MILRPIIEFNLSCLPGLVCTKPGASSHRTGPMQQPLQGSGISGGTGTTNHIFLARISQVPGPRTELLRICKEMPQAKHRQLLQHSWLPPTHAGTRNEKRGQQQRAQDRQTGWL